MSKTRIATVVVLGAVQKIRKPTGSHPGLFLSLCRQGVGGTIRGAMLMLMAALLAASTTVSQNSTSLIFVRQDSISG
jgi:hypothetical protein